MNNDHKATVMGVLLAALAGTTVDFPALLTGDLNQIARVIGVVVIFCFGLYTNRPDRLFVLVLAATSVASAQNQVDVRFTPEPMAVPASVLAKAKDMGRWKVEACLAATATVARTIPMERMSMVSGNIAFIDPDDALMVLNSNARRSTASRITTILSWTGRGTAIALALASRSNSSWSTGIGVGAGLAPDIMAIIQNGITPPSIVPLVSAVKWPITLEPGACMTDHWFAAKMRMPKPVMAVIQ